MIYVLQAHPDGRLATPVPEVALNMTHQRPRFVVVDSLVGGSGETFDWEVAGRLGAERLAGVSRDGWLLAGGLRPENVAEAVRVARPTGVDVSSGVAGEDGMAKDRGKVVGFLRGARGRLGEGTDRPDEEEQANVRAM